MVGQRLLTRSHRLRGGAPLTVLGALALLVALQREGHVSQVHNRDIGLQEVVQRSALIVVAHRATPPNRSEEVPIDPNPKSAVKAADGARPPKPVPPFVRSWSRFVVEDVVRGPKQLIGKVIEAKSADDGEELYLHRMYYVEGQSESPIFDSYKSTIDWKKGEPARVIVFLSEHEGQYAFAAQGALELPTRRTEIAKLVAQPGTPSKAPDIHPEPAQPAAKPSL